MDYPEEFETLWRCFAETEKLGLGKRGNKVEAYRAFKSARIDVDIMLDALQKQAKAKLNDKKHGRFFDPFKHACRWLKYECWNDEVIEETQPINIESMVQKKLDQITDRSWSES